MNNAEIADQFVQLADLLELEGANPFRIRAYRNAARTIENLPAALADLAADPHELLQIEGIGKDLAEKITVLLTTGQLPQLLELQLKIPAEVVSMLRIPGLGPKKVAVLFKQLQLTTLDQLKQAAEQGKIAQQKGFGKKTEQIILEGLSQLEQAGSRFYLADVKPFVEGLLTQLRALPNVVQAEVAGSARRLKETIGDLDLLVTADDPTAAMDLLARHPQTESVLSRGETKQRVRFKPLPRCLTPDGNRMKLECDLRVVPAESFGAALQYFTGSKEHNIIVRRIAQQHGYKLNEYGLFQEDQRIAGDHEAGIYAALNLLCPPPELREDRGELEVFEIPTLLEPEDIRGDLHMHTTATDGTATITEMIEAARQRGLEYIAITDHSKRVSMANGLDETRLLAHWDEIRQIRENYQDIEVFCGIECDILEDAELDLTDAVLAEADFVIAVLHYGLKQPKPQIMTRLLNAIQNPHVDMIGHLTGRMIGLRPGAEIDFDDVFKAAADHGVLLEINAHPARLDLNDIRAAQAKEYGIPIVINTDAHSTTGFDVLKWGVAQARRAGLTKADVANTRSAAEFRQLLR